MSNKDCTLTTAYVFSERKRRKEHKKLKRLVKKYLKEVKRVIHNFHKEDILLRKEKNQTDFSRIVLNFRYKKTTIRSSEEERRVDALALGAEEGRDKLRKATVSCK